ncbi:hypothetical protein CsSME_00042621 [Camellia sinensis var. sinensis]
MQANFNNHGVLKVNPTLYRSLVGSLMYLTNTRPDIVYLVSIISRFMTEPSQIHFSRSQATTTVVARHRKICDKVCEENNNELDDEVEPIDLWEEEDDAEPEIGDGGDGGGVVLQNCPWGERALSIAHEILLQFGDDMKLYAFKTTPRGYIYVRLDKLSNEYGCPGVEEIESYSQQYKKRLDEVGALGQIPDDLALERLLKVPDDMNRFKDMPMRVSYVEDLESKCPEKNGVFYLDSIKTEAGSCVWRLAGVKENRDPSAKGRPLSRKQKDWRLELPYAMFKKALFLDY